MRRATFGWIALLVAGAAQATTFAPSQKTDPLTGEKVASNEIMSYGSYIYRWPSKFDLVFWPLTEESWICLNPKNGYGAFNQDFEKLSDEEKKTLKEWLARNYDPAKPPKTHKEKLLWLEQVYRRRKMDDDFWCLFYRLAAYVYRDEPDRSLEYVRKAIPLLEAKLNANPQDGGRLEALFLLGEYYRRIGEAAKSNEFFAQVKTAKYKDKDGTVKTGHPYFLELVREREQGPAPKQ